MTTNYQKTREYALKRANEKYYEKNYNLDFNKHHDDYKNYRLIYSKILKQQDFNLEILLIILKFKQKEKLYDALLNEFSDEEFDNLKKLRQMKLQEEEINDFKEKM